MQTFLPYSRFDASAAVLDDLRLGKQRVETLQILRALVWPTYRGWKNHPATAMWRGFTDALVCYGLAICDEWERRGRADAVRMSLTEFSGRAGVGEDELARDGRMPPWLGTPSFHAGHRASLVAKLPQHYRRYFPDADPELPYVWPAPMFRRWPVRRQARMSRARAADALGIPAATGAGSDLALLTALLTPGPVLWVHDRPFEAAPAVAGLRPVVEARAPGRISPSVARPPSAEDLASVAEERTAPPLLRVYRLEVLRAGSVRRALSAPAVVIAEDVSDIRPLRRWFPDAEIVRLSAR